MWTCDIFWKSERLGWNDGFIRLITFPNNVSLSCINKTEHTMITHIFIYTHKVEENRKQSYSFHVKKEWRCASRCLLWSCCQVSVTACSGTLLPEREPQTFSMFPFPVRSLKKGAVFTINMKSLHKQPFRHPYQITQGTLLTAAVVCCISSFAFIWSFQCLLSLCFVLCIAVCH